MENGCFIAHGIEAIHNTLKKINEKARDMDVSSQLFSESTLPVNIVHVYYRMKLSENAGIT